MPNIIFWVGLFAPKSTPPDIVATLSAALDKAAESNSSRPSSVISARNTPIRTPRLRAFWDTDAKLADEAGATDRQAGVNGASGKSMTLRADHVAGGFFVAFGIAVIALSGDLPFGHLVDAGSRLFAENSSPCSSSSSGPSPVSAARMKARLFVSILWDGWTPRLAGGRSIIAAAVALYVTLGFVPTMVLTTRR